MCNLHVINSNIKYLFMSTVDSLWSKLGLQNWQNFSSRAMPGRAPGRAWPRDGLLANVHMAKLGRSRAYDACATCEALETAIDEALRTAIHKALETAIDRPSLAYTHTYVQVIRLFSLPIPRGGVDG